MTATIRALVNIGQTLADRLQEVGINSRDDLERLGPARAYQALRQRAGRKLPVCYYLYSLEGALTGRDWRDLSAEQKASLRLAAGLEPDEITRAPGRSRKRLLHGPPGLQ